MVKMSLAFVLCRHRARPSILPKLGYRYYCKTFGVIVIGCRSRCSRHKDWPEYWNNTANSSTVSTSTLLQIKLFVDSSPLPILPVDGPDFGTTTMIESSCAGTTNNSIGGLRVVFGQASTDDLRTSMLLYGYCTVQVQTASLNYGTHQPIWGTRLTATSTSA
jgi:hypothetical protein